MDTNTKKNIQIAGRSFQAIRLFVLVTLFLLGLDLLSKSLAFEYVADEPVALHSWQTNSQADLPMEGDYEPYVVIPHLLELKLVVNNGAVFGIGAGQRAFFLFVGVIALGFIGGFFYRSDKNARLLHICYAFILAGAIGNIYDRYVFGVVRDLFHMLPGVPLPFGWSWGIRAGNEAWPWIFNAADVFLLMGVFSIMLLSWKSEKQPQND